jgi:hypothetical protein
MQWKTLLSPLPYMLHAPPISLFEIWSHKKIWCGVQIIKLHIMQSSPLSCYVISLRPIYLPQCPILKCPQPTFPPQCERPIFTLAQNKRQIVVLYIVILYIGYQTGRQKILPWMTASIPWLHSALNFFINTILIC